MQINKSKKTSTSQSSGGLFDDDFASGFEDSKFDKFKPALKVLSVLVLLVGAAWGVAAYFGGTDTKNNADKDYKANTAQQVEDSDHKLSQCIADATAKNPTPDTSDANFYPKLISGYDAQLACYDKYPEANGAVSRSSIEYARDNALDSSGTYKDTYTSSGGSSSSATSKNSITGCDYSLSESEYIGCTDRYYAAHSSPSSTPSNTGSVNTPSYTPPSRTVDAEWCSSKNTEVATLRSNYQSARDAVQAKQTEINNIPQTIRQRFANSGATMTESRRINAEAAEKRKLDNEMNGLVAIQNDALSKYNAAQTQYSSKCY